MTLMRGLQQAVLRSATVYVCDMEKGIISAGIEEEFKLPTGVTKKISCKKTIVADEPMEDN